MAVVIGLILFEAVLAGLLLGYAARQERRGRRLDWAEWPVPGTEVFPPERVEYRKAA